MIESICNVGGMFLCEECKERGIARQGKAEHRDKIKGKL